MVCHFSTQSPFRWTQSLTVGQVVKCLQRKIQHRCRDIKSEYQSPLHRHFHNGYLSLISTLEKKKRKIRTDQGVGCMGDVAKC